jgi:hypothetical protein
MTFAAIEQQRRQLSGHGEMTAKMTANTAHADGRRRTATDATSPESNLCGRRQMAADYAAAVVKPRAVVHRRSPELAIVR